MDSIWKIARKKEMHYTLLTLLASGVNYVTMILYGRMMDVEGYARVTTTQSFLANYTVFIMPVGILLCREIAENKRENRAERTGELLSLALVVAVVSCVVPLCFRTLIMRYLDQQTMAELLVLVACIATYCAFYVLRGATQGKQFFLALGIAELLLYGVKLPVSLVLIRGGAGVFGCMAGIAVAQTAAAVFMLMKHGLRNGRLSGAGFSRLTEGTFLSAYVHILLVQITLSLLMNNGEILLANFYCEKKEIGLYMVAAQLSKIIFYVISIMGTVLLPKVAASNDNPGRQRALLGKTFALAAAAAVLYGIALLVVRGPLIALLYGEEYAGAGRYVFPALAYAVCLSAFFLYNQYLMATDRQNRPAIIMLFATAAAVAAVLLLKPDMYRIPWFFTGLVVSVLLLSMLLSSGDGDGKKAQ